MKVLITDDSSTIRMILKGLLKQLQITDIVEASNGAQALEVAVREKLDLVLLDIHMPTMDGLACLENLKSKPATLSLPVIIISSDTDTAQVDRARALGALAYIQKPFRIEGLREALNSAFPAQQALQ